jgi:hypothetical protein
MTYHEKFEDFSPPGGRIISIIMIVVLPFVLLLTLYRLDIHPSREEVGILKRRTFLLMTVIAISLFLAPNVPIIVDYIINPLAMGLADTWLYFLASIVLVTLYIRKYYNGSMFRRAFGALVTFTPFGLVTLALLLTLRIGPVRPSLSSPDIRTEEPMPRAPTVGHAFEEWILSRPTLGRYANQGRRYPVFLVTAQGGGLYAAYHVASFLGNLQAVCPQFASHIFAVSSVSGGSVGATIFSALGDLISFRILTPDETTCLGLEERPQQNDLHTFMRTYFENDFLSPLIRHALFVDLPSNLNPIGSEKADRSAVLRREFESAWLMAARRAREIGPNVDSPLRRPYDSHWRPNSLGPALLLNTTEKNSGRRVVFSPFSLSPTWNAFDLIADQGISMSTAASLSAAFPLISAESPLSLSVRGSEQLTDALGLPRWETLTLLDGGFADNSGVDTMSEVLSAIQKVDQSGVPGFDIYVLSFVTLGDTTAPAGAGLLGQVTTLSNARGLASISKIENMLQFGVVKAIYIAPIAPNRMDLLLSWTLPRQNFQTIDIINGTHSPEISRILAKGTDWESLERRATSTFDKVLEVLRR